MTTLVVIRENIKNGVLDDVFYPLIIKKEIATGMILDCRFYDSEAKLQDIYKKHKKWIISGLIIVIGLGFVLNSNLNILVINGMMIFLLTILWS